MLQFSVFCHSSCLPSFPVLEKKPELLPLCDPCLGNDKVAEVNWGIYCCCQLQNLALPAWTDLVLNLWGLNKPNTGCTWKEIHACKMQGIIMNEAVTSDLVAPGANILQQRTPVPSTTEFHRAHWSVARLTSRSIPLLRDVRASAVISIFSLHISLYSELESLGKKGSPIKTVNNILV